MRAGKQTDPMNNKDNKPAAPQPASEETLPVRRPAVGDKIRLLASIWDDGQDHHPGGWLGKKWDVLFVRKIYSDNRIGVSHEGAAGHFIITTGEYEHTPTQPCVAPEGAQTASVSENKVDAEGHCTNCGLEVLEYEGGTKEEAIRAHKCPPGFREPKADKLLVLEAAPAVWSDREKPMTFEDAFNTEPMSRASNYDRFKYYWDEGFEAGRDSMSSPVTGEPKH